MGKIVYHGTWSPKSPHEYGESFHAGTAQSAQDRLSSGEGIPEGAGFMNAVHSYEIPSDVKINPKMHSDPDAGDTYKNIWGDKPLNPIPSRPTQVSQYLNDHEDRGSTSYVIPSRMVAQGTVKHLGAQWTIDPHDERSAPIIKAYKTMTGAN
jgi:hypothetical protein